MCVGFAVLNLLQTVVAYCGALFFCIAAIVIMVQVQNDNHLMYMNVYEEWLSTSLLVYASLTGKFCVFVS